MFKPKENIKQASYPELLKHFNSLFDHLALRHSYYNAFDNFLDCCINAFCINYDADTMERIRKTYTQDERYMFGEMLQIWVLCMDKRIHSDSSFHDFFGNFYEEKAMSKKYGFAQYFTPEPICNLMVSLVNISEETSYVYEPTCGSGRLNLAMHAHNNKLFHYANDLDITCAKMTTLNFLIHGVKGMVTCDDGLFVKNDFKGAFLINYQTAPFIEYITNADLAYKILNSIVPTSKPKLNIDFEKLEKSNIASTPVRQVNSLSELGEQLSLF